VGVYWGRFLRFNSWEVVTKPQRLAHQAIQSFVANDFGIWMVIRYFVIITVFYYLLKLIDLALWDFVRQRRSKPLIAPEPSVHLPL
jgi:uncharacterized membrane protein